VLEYRVTLLLRSTALLLGVMALALIIRPGNAISIIGLTSSRELEWGFRLIGITNLALAALISLAAAFLGERGLRQAAAIMILTSAATAVSLFFMPGGWNLWKILLILLQIAMAAGYFFALKGRRRNR
jgi:hypothetical protein